MQQDTTGDRGRRDDPLNWIRNILRAGEENLTDRQHDRLTSAFTARGKHVEVELAWRCAQQVRSAYHQPTHAAGRAVAEKVLAFFTSCPILEVARLGRTVKQWSREFLGYCDIDGANNGGTEAMNGLICFTDAPPAASATETTIASECSSSAAADSSCDPTLSPDPPTLFLGASVSGF